MEESDPVLVTEVRDNLKKKGKKTRNISPTHTVSFSQDRLSERSVNTEDYDGGDDEESRLSHSFSNSQNVAALEKRDGETDDEEEEEDEAPSDTDYDTDLEMNADKWLYPEKYEHDTTGVAKYNRACEEEGVQPIRFVIKHIQDDNLRLKHHGLGLPALRALTAPLEINTTIEQIDLEGNWIMTEGTNYLCQVLRENVYVTDLNLSENKIDSEGARAVCELLIGNRSIEHLNLAGNDIGNHSAELFYQLLTKNSVLKSLNLRHNKFEDISAHYFKDAMTENETLRLLDLSWNCFQCKGCVQLAEGIKENIGLTDFFVVMNGFGLEGGLKLGEAIQINRKLRRLDTSYCRLPLEASYSIAHGLHHNDYLEHMDISNNFIPDAGAFQILTAVDQNEASNLKLLNLGSTIVHDDFKRLEDKLKEERGLQVLHGGVGYTFVKPKEYDPMQSFLRDPMTKLKEWVAQAGYRMIDLLKRFDKDGSMSISHEEFKKGIKSTSIPITEEQLDILINRLDKDGDGEIDYKELMDGDKENRKAKRDIQKFIQEETEKKRDRINSVIEPFTTAERVDLIKKIL